MRDFNEILLTDEKLGGLLRPERQMAGFRVVVEDCNFLEVLFRGSKFTWLKGDGDNVIFERLDRRFATVGCFGLFPKMVEVHLIVSHSDHCLLLFTILGSRLGGGRCFKFENFWLRKGGCKQVVMESWGTTGVVGFNGLITKISRCSERLGEWNKATFGNLGTRLRRKRRSLSFCYWILMP
ncbi:hypothetical protein PTKIN_Ptkin14bG0063000 [Pterospermum kingtungense]